MADRAGSALRPLRVALLSPCYWPEVRRGTERFVRELADGLLAEGHRPRLITSHRGLPRRTVENGLPVTRVWRPPPSGLLESRAFERYLTHWPLSEAVLRAGDDDVAHAVFQTDALAASRWTRSTGRPSVLSFMGMPNRQGLSRRLRPQVIRRAVAGVTATVVLSEVAARAFRRCLGVEARVIAPGVNLRAFTPGPGGAEAPTIFCASSVEEPQKRVGLLLRAFALLRRDRPAARLLISRPRDARAALGLTQPGVELVDVDETSALAATYRNASVSVLPSLGEAFGLVLVESLACGTPVVASNLDGMREVVDRESIGRLFDGDDERALASSLTEALDLAQDPRTPAACVERARDFSTERTTGAYLDLYRALLAG